MHTTNKRITSFYCIEQLDESFKLLEANVYIVCKMNYSYTANIKKWANYIHAQARMAKWIILHRYTQKVVALCKKPVKHRWQQMNSRDGRSIAKNFICNNLGKNLHYIHLDYKTSSDYCQPRHSPVPETAIWEFHIFVNQSC